MDAAHVYKHIVIVSTMCGFIFNSGSLRSLLGQFCFTAFFVSVMFGTLRGMACPPLCVSTPQSLFSQHGAVLCVFMSTCFQKSSRVTFNCFRELDFTLNWLFTVCTYKNLLKAHLNINHNVIF